MTSDHSQPNVPEVPPVASKPLMPDSTGPNSRPNSTGGSPHAENLQGANNQSLNYTPSPTRNLWLCIPWAVAPACVLILAAVMSVGEGRMVYLPMLDAPVPETCGMRRSLQVDCPGCGLTRTFIHLAHGDFRKAWNLHSIGIALFAFVAAQIPLAVVHYVSTDIKFRRAITRRNEQALIVLAIAVMLRWVYLLATGNIL